MYIIASGYQLTTKENKPMKAEEQLLESFTWTKQREKKNETAKKTN